MSTHLLLAGARQSRFVSRWLAADPDREAALARLSGLSLAELDLDQLLSKLMADGLPVGAALRRLRGLLFAAIVERDVAGRADLAEVLAAISRFADFAVQKALDEQGKATKVIMQVHDELVFEVPESEVEWVRTEVPRIMAGVADLKVPLLAEVGFGPNWEQAH